MAENTLPAPVSEVPPEPLSPREARLKRAGDVLGIGAVVNSILTLLVILLAFAGGARLIPNVFPTLHAWLFSQAAGPDDAAVASVVLLMQLNISALLVLMVGVRARELWGVVGVWLLAVINVLGLLLLGFTPALLTIAFALAAGVILSRDGRAFRLNPVMLKELRGRMRGVRAFVVLTVYLGLMSAFAALLYLVYTPLARTSGSAAAGEIGRILFMGIVGIELLLILFIAPAFTAGAVTGELERQTYDLLRTTLLSSPSLVTGKLESALTYVLLLLLSAIPLQSIAFLFGGVSEYELLLSFVVLTVTAIALGTIGIFFSTFTLRTLSASIRAYATTLGVAFIVPVVLSIFLDIIARAVTAPSPTLEAVLAYLNDFLTSLNPLSTALQSQSLLINQQEIGFWTYTLKADGSTIPRVSPWITFTIIYLIVSTILMVISIRQMHRTEGLS